MRHTVLLFSSLALVASGGCASSGSAEVEPAMDVVATPRLTGLIQPRGGSMSGEVAIAPTARAGEFRINLSLRGSEAGQQHPYHVHQGRCDATGPVVGSSVAYQVLQIRGDGNIDLSQTIRERLEPGRSYYVDVHPSRADVDRIIACADLLPAP